VDQNQSSIYDIYFDYNYVDNDRIIMTVILSSMMSLLISYKLSIKRFNKIFFVNLSYADLFYYKFTIKPKLDFFLINYKNIL